MKKKKEQPIEEAPVITPPVKTYQEAEPDFGLGSKSIWIGRDAMQRFKEQLEEAGHGYYSESEDGEADAGARHVAEFLHEFQAITGMHLRLIFGLAEAPLHELDISKVPTTQGQLDNDDIQKWICAGASLIGDVPDLI